jgi:hypothetical protein
LNCQAPLTSDHKRTYSVRPSVGNPVAVYEVLVPPGGAARLADPTPLLPIHNPYCVAVPAVHWNVTDDEGSVEPLTGLVITPAFEKAV